MASTWSDLKFELIGTGEQSGTWGTTTNANIGDAIEQAIGGKADVTMSSTSITISLTDTTALQDARALYLNLTGTPGGAATLNVPAVQKSYIVYNNTTGGFAVTVKVSGQTGVSVPNGKVMVLYDNGTDVVDAITHLTSLTLGSALAVASGGTGVATLTANNVVLGNGTSAVQFVAPGSVGNVLTSNGTTWTSSAPASTPGGSTTQVQYNNAGAFGGITNATTDGTTLSMTSPKVITGINDTNGNELLKVTATASAVNELTLANAAANNNPVLSATGNDTNIGITLTPKGTGGVVFPAGAVGTPAITTTGDTNTGLFFPAADTIAFVEGGAEAMRITSSGALLTGLTSSVGTNPLRVQSKGGAGGTAPYGGYAVISGNDEVAGYISIVSSGENSFGIYADPENLRASSSLQFNVDGTERMRITSGGDVQIANGNLVISTSGKGIDFSATSGTGTSELLADYEEGTFTPAYNTSNSNMTVTDNGTGTYTKIGRVVHVYMRFLVSAIASAGTGDLRITGLPFTQASGSPVGVVSVIYEANFAANTFPTAGRINGGASYIDLYKRSGSDARSALNVANVAADLAANSGFDWYYACYYV